MKLREALENTKALSDKQVMKLIDLGLCNSERNLTTLGQRLLALDQSAADELNANLQAQWPKPWPDWVTEPLLRNGRVFGPAYPCGDMAAYSLGF